jgi:hypothetical protein
LVGDRPLLLGCWTVGLPLSLDLRMGAGPDEALWDIGQLFKDLKQQKQQVRRTARARPFSPKPLSPSELTIDRYLTCPPLPEGLPWIQLINRPLPKSVFPKSPSSPPSVRFLPPLMRPQEVRASFSSSLSFVSFCDHTPRVSGGAGSSHLGLGTDPVLLECWTCWPVGLPLLGNLRMGTDPDEPCGLLVNYLKQQVQRTARSWPFHFNRLAPLS